MLKHKSTNKLLLTTSAFVLGAALSGCLPESDGVVSRDDSGDDRAAQTVNYARSLQQYATVSQYALTNSAAWQAGAVSEGAIDMAALGEDSGPAEGYVESAFCFMPGSATDGFHLTWFEDRNAENAMALKGVGTGGGSGIARVLQKELSPELIGMKRGAVIERLNNGPDLAIPASCMASSEIPEGSPVLIFDNFRAPAPSLVEMTRFEYRTAACTDSANNIGERTERLQVTFHTDGSRSAPATGGGGTLSLPAGDNSNFGDGADWQLWMDGCDGAVALPAVEIAPQTVTITDAAASIGVEGGGATVTKDVACRDVQINEGEVNGANVSDILNEVPDGTLLGNTVDGEDDSVTIAEFTTCGASVQEVALDGVSATVIGASDPIPLTTECGGAAGTFTDTVDGTSGTATHTKWDGVADYTRQVLQLQVNAQSFETLNGSNVTERELWQGQALSCTREEQINVNCTDKVTQFNGDSAFTLVDTGGFFYDRQNSVNGWADPVNLVPNDPANPSWNPNAVSCAWDERRDFGTCPAGFTQAQQGREVRRHTVNQGQFASAGSVIFDINPWTTEQNQICTQTTTTSGELKCKGTTTTTTISVNNENQTVNTSTGTVPYNNCPQPIVCNFAHQSICPVSCAGTGVSGPWGCVIDDKGNYSPVWGGICFGAGTLVEMEDTSLKAIQDIQIGDQTSAGKVLNVTRSTISDDDFTDPNGMARGGLYHYDGIAVTGNHVVRSDDGSWQPVADAAGSLLVGLKERKRVVYNLVTENHYVMIRGETNNHVFADAINNINNRSAKGYFQSHDKRDFQNIVG